MIAIEQHFFPGPSVDIQNRNVIRVEIDRKLDGSTRGQFESSACRLRSRYRL